MRLFSEATLLKMETTWTQHRKELEASPSFILTWLYPTLLLKPNEIYTRKSYLRTAIIAALGTTLIISIVSIGILLATALELHLTWTDINNPKMRVLLIAFLSKQGFDQLPLLPFIILLFSFGINWLPYFFWNRRAKRLQRQGPVSVSIIAAALVPDDPNVWPPPPRL